MDRRREQAGAAVAERLQELERVIASSVDPARSMAYFEQGTLFEASQQLERALRAFQQVTGALSVAGVASKRRILHRQRRWGDLLPLLESIVQRETAPSERTAAIFEHMVVAAHAQRHGLVRAGCEALLTTDPLHPGGLFELVRQSGRTGDTTTLVAALERLAEIHTIPEVRAGYLCEVARLSPTARPSVLDQIAELLQQMPPDSEATYRLRLASLHLANAERSRAPQQLLVARDAMIDALTREGSDPPATPIQRGRLAALLRRQASLMRMTSPSDAWAYLARARELMPADPLLVAESLELAIELEWSEEVPNLVQAFVEHEPSDGQALMASVWAADALDAHAKDRGRYRELLRAVSHIAPGACWTTALVEYGQLQGKVHTRTFLELADAYEAAAETASRAGTIAPWSIQPDVAAATTLLVQAAELLGSYVATPTTIQRARQALARALELSPGSSTVIDAWLGLESHAGGIDLSVAAIRATGVNALGRDALEYAAAVAYRHDQRELAHQLLAEHVNRYPRDLELAWMYDALLSDADIDVERRRDLLTRLARTAETAEERRVAALLRVALSLQSAGDALPRDLLLTAGSELAHDMQLEQLHVSDSIKQLAMERISLARSERLSDAARAAWREGTWLTEIRLGEMEVASAMYAEWCRAFPNELAAHEGRARCAVAAGRAGAEIEARSHLARLQDTTASHWLLARSLHLDGQRGAAIRSYRTVLDKAPDPALAASCHLLTIELAIATASISSVREHVAALADMVAGGASGGVPATLAGWLALESDDRGAAARFFELAQTSDEPANVLLGTALLVERDLTATTQSLAQLAAHLAPDERARLQVTTGLLALANGDRERARELGLEAQPRLIDAFPLQLLLDESDGVVADPLDDDALAARANYCNDRAALVDDPVSKQHWQLERAHALDAASRHDEATALLAELPPTVVVLATIRQIARRVGDRATYASATRTLGMTAASTEVRIQHLREAAQLYENGATRDLDLACLIYEQLAALTADGPEIDRWLELVRARRDARALLHALTVVATRHVGQRAVAALTERAHVLRKAGYGELATADLDALLEHDPDNLECLTSRAGLAYTSGDLPLAIELWTHYLTLEPDAQRRQRVEALLERASDDDAEADPTITERFAVDALVPEDTITERSLDATPVPGSDQSAVRRLTSTRTGVTPRPPLPQNRRRATPSSLVVPALPPAVFAGYTPRTLPSWTLTPQSLVVHDVSTSFDESQLVMLKPGEIDNSSRAALEHDLFVFEREATVVTSSEAKAGLLIQAARAALRLGQLDHATNLLTASLAAGVEAVVALSGLRRLALARQDSLQALAWLERELARSSASERPALQLMRAALQLAVSARPEPHGRLWPDSPDADHVVELVFAPARGASTASALNALAASAAPPLAIAAGLATAVQLLCSGAPERAAQAFHGVRVRSPHAVSNRWYGLLASMSLGLRSEIAAASLELAYHVESDAPELATGLALCAQIDVRSSDNIARSTPLAAAELSVRIAPRQPLVLRLAAETALALDESALASQVLTKWSRAKCPPHERHYAAARAAELVPGALGRLWKQVLELAPDDTYAAAQLRASLASTDPAQALHVDLSLARASGREFPLLRAAGAMLARGDVHGAAEILAVAHQQFPTSLVCVELFATALGRAGAWQQCAELLTSAANGTTAQGARRLQLRAALAWTRCARHQAGLGANAYAAWAQILATQPHHVVAQQAIEAFVSDASADLETLLTSQLARARSPSTQENLSLRLARMTLASDPTHTLELLRALPLQSPRVVLARALAAAAAGDMTDLVSTFEQRAQLLASSGRDLGESINLLVRAAALAFAAAPAQSARLAVEVNRQAPGLAKDLLDLIRTRQLAAVTETAASPQLTSRTRALRDSERALADGDPHSALAHAYQAFEQNPNDPLTHDALLTVANEAHAPEAMMLVARAQLRGADATQDIDARAGAYEIMADFESMHRNNHRAALQLLTEAWQANPLRCDLRIRLETETTSAQELAPQHAIRERELERLRARYLTAPDIALLAQDSAVLATRMGHDDHARELAALALELGTDRHDVERLLEVLVATPSDALARVQRQMAESSSSPVLAAMCWVRAAATFAAIGHIDQAFGCFDAALTVRPTWSPALAARRELALVHQRWDIATATSAMLAELEPELAADHWYMAAVVWMDKLNDLERARTALEAALRANPGHRDAFLRLYAILDGRASTETRAALIRARLKHERDGSPRIELLRTLEGFLSADPDAATGRHNTSLTGYTDATDHATEDPTDDSLDDATKTAILRRRSATVPAVECAELVKRLSTDRLDGATYRSLSRLLEGTAARVSAELATVLGADEDIEHQLLASPASSSALLGRGVDASLFAGAHYLQFLRVLRQLAPTLAKSVPLDGRTLFDQAQPLPVELVAPVQALAHDLGLPEPEVYVSDTQPWVAVADLSIPSRLVIGRQFTLDVAHVQFSAGGALKLAELGLAIIARMPIPTLQATCDAILTLLDLPPATSPDPTVKELTSRLRQLAAPALLQRLSAASIGALQISAATLAQDLQVLQWRAGLLASGSVMPALRIAAATTGKPMRGLLEDPRIRAVVDLGLAS